MSDKLTHADFQQRLHSKFRLMRDETSPIELELSEVSALKTARRQEMFSVYFRGPAEFVLPQCIYRLEHETLAGCELFLVPIGRDGDGVTYEAVFNRLLPSSTTQ
jgi:hypothetical protein